jgi:hypothetical protein
MSEPHLSEATPSPVGRRERRSSGGAKVTVACKLPCGLTLNVCAMHTEQELVMGGGVRDVQRAHVMGQIRLNGTGHKPNEAPRSLIVHNFALTRGVDKEMWERWLEDNKDSPVVANGLVFAFENDGDVDAFPKGGPMKIERAEAA